MTERVCFLMQVRADRLPAYTAAHAVIWPEMQQALTETGWRNYSLFVRADGLVVGYLETDDFDAALAGMDAHAVNDRWQAAMAPFFPAADGDANTRPDQRMQRLTEYFHLA
ncbi:MAG: L-rhamnose mutarotase [Nakamurella sp.]